MLGTFIRLALSLIMLAINIALRLAIIIGSLIDLMLRAIGSALAKRRQNDELNMDTPRGWNLPRLRSPKEPAPADEFTARPLHPRRKR